jgi:hypothetical protein
LPIRHSFPEEDHCPAFLLAAATAATRPHDIGADQIPGARELTVQNLRKFDQRLKIELGPFGHHAVEYLAAMPPPRAIKTGKKFFSEFLV